MNSELLANVLLYAGALAIFATVIWGAVRVLRSQSEEHESCACDHEHDEQQHEEA